MKEIYDLNKTIKSKGLRVVWYRNISEVKEGKLKCNIKGWTNKASQRMKSNKQNIENYTEGREIETII